jgi:hypothetical protein
VHAPPPPPVKDAPAEAVATYKQVRKQQSSGRIYVEHAIAEHKGWRPLQRYLAAVTPTPTPIWRSPLAIAGLVSDRAARR